MSITIHRVERDCDIHEKWFLVATFSVDGVEFRCALENGQLDRSSLNLDSDAQDNVQLALDMFIAQHEVEVEPYSLDFLEEQVRRLSYVTGKPFVLDRIGAEFELRELVGDLRRLITHFNTRAELAAWLKNEFEDPTLEPGPAKRVNANISALLHRDFKAACARRDVEMQDVLSDLIISWLEGKR